MRAPADRTARAESRASPTWRFSSPARPAESTPARTGRTSRSRASVRSREEWKVGENSNACLLLLVRLIDAVEQGAVGEMLGVNRVPAAEDFIHREQIDRWELSGVALQDRRIAGTEIVLGGDLLADVRIQMLQISLSD